LCRCQVEKEAAPAPLNIVMSSARLRTLSVLEVSDARSNYQS